MFDIGNSNNDDAYGWIAALYALVAFGTYGVSIKETSKLNVHPLVFQSFKTFVMVIISPVVLLMGAELKFTPFGLLSGFLWVIGGTAGVAAVRLAGMALAVGVWSSVMICINFIWGILIFHEPVANLIGTTIAFALLILGLIGMSRYAVSDVKKIDLDNVNNNNNNNNNSSISNSRDDNNDDDDNDDTYDELMELIPTPSVDQSEDSSERNIIRRIRTEDVVVDVVTGEQQTSNNNEHHQQQQQQQSSSINESAEIIHVRLLYNGKVLPKRTVGIAAAVFNGIFAGSALIPVNFAKRHGFGGTQYYMSYAFGSCVANIVLWLIYFTVLVINVHKHYHNDSNNNIMNWKEKIIRAIDNMPAWHIKKLWKAGLCGGFLVASAMLCTVISVTYLGQGIGSSVVQAKIIVSGLWGIFYYKEIENRDAIRKWFLSASFCVMGIIWLSLERLAAKSKVH